MKKIALLLIAFVLYGFCFSVDYIYFYGDGCPHCKQVESYLESIDGYKKFNITKKEVWFDKSNAIDMWNYANKLGIEKEQLGVPFLVIKDGENYDYKIGDQPIIQHFKTIVSENNLQQKQHNILTPKVLVPVFFVFVITLVVFYNIRNKKG